MLTILAAITLAALTAPAAQASLLAPKGTCHHAQDSAASHRAKRHALRCLIHYARTHHGQHALAGNRRLHTSTRHKTVAILRCGFSHTPCGHPFGSYARAAGWCSSGSSWRLGENLAHGYHTARAVIRAWLASPEHRANLLGSWHSIGTSLRHGVWAVQFGRCGP